MAFPLCRSPRGSVDRNDCHARHRGAPAGRSPRGSVDRNRRAAALSCAGSGVAPLAGAWIETASTMARRMAGSSLPSRERGSKLRRCRGCAMDTRVAPLAGAWIETCSPPSAAFWALSLPSRERGSKQQIPPKWAVRRASRSPRGSVDRNKVQDHLKCITRVAPLAGAWIETRAMHAAASKSKVAPLAGAWIETVSKILQSLTIPVSLPSRERGSKL